MNTVNLLNLCDMNTSTNNNGNECDKREWEKGAITAEFATTLPAVMALLAVIIALAAAFGTQYRVSDAARVGARLAAIGAEDSQIEAAISRSVGALPEPPTIHREGEWVTIRVRKSLRVGPLWLSPLGVSATATAWLEPE